MDYDSTDRRAVPADRPRARARHRQLTIALLVGGLAAVSVPAAAGAQFGMLRKLKNAVTGDSADKAKDTLKTKDSVKARATSNGEVALPDTAKSQSLFSRAKGIAGAAASGVSVKDAAMAASGVGLVGIAARKAGLDPTAAIANAAQKAAGNAMAGRGASPTDTTHAAMPPNAARATPPANAPAGAMMMGPTIPPGAMLNLTPRDTETISTFQRKIQQTAMAASGGSVTAQARLDAWQQLAMRRQPEMQTLATQGAGGDMTAYAKLNRLEIDMMREWLDGKTVTSVKPVRTGKKKSAKP